MEGRKCLNGRVAALAANAGVLRTTWWTEESNFPLNLYVINANLRLLLVIIRQDAEELLTSDLLFLDCILVVTRGRRRE